MFTSSSFGCRTAREQALQLADEHEKTSSFDRKGCWSTCWGQNPGRARAGILPWDVYKKEEESARADCSVLWTTLRVLALYAVPVFDQLAPSERRKSLWIARAAAAQPARRPAASPSNRLSARTPSRLLESQVELKAAYETVPHRDSIPAPSPGRVPRPRQPQAATDPPWPTLSSSRSLAPCSK